MAKKSGDILCQRAVKLVEQSAANASVSEKVDFAYTIQSPQHVALDIVRVDVEVLTPDMLQVSAAFEQRFAIGLKETIANMDMRDNAILFYLCFQGVQAGPPANQFLFSQPLTLVGYPMTEMGAVLAAPDRIFCHVQSGGMAAAMSIAFNIYFRYRTVTPAVALEMLQLLNVLS